MIIKMTVMAMSVVLVSVIISVVSGLVPVSFDAAPGHWIWPANAEPARTSVRIKTAILRGKVFTFSLLE